MKHEFGRKMCWGRMRVKRWYRAIELSRYCGLTAQEVGHFLGVVHRIDGNVISKREKYIQTAYGNAKTTFWRKDENVSFEGLKEMIKCRR